jgi:Zn-dependent M28 family amino/carboxypeptidase
VRSNLDYLAGPVLHGRGSGTEDEHHAAKFIARKLKEYGLAPAADDGRYIQAARVRSRNVTKAPVVHSKVGDAPLTTSRTWNVLAQIEGTNEKNQIILLSAHLDHLGVKNGKTYPGADDDASGTVAVMELARALAKEPRPRRTIVFALWGSEETGLVGARYFLQHPTFNLQNVVANLEFEMIGRPDPKLQRDQLWLTGWERTDLGPELAAHGAKLVADPNPDQSFFTRSDNYALAKYGIVAQTISSFGLHRDYHQPTDTLARIDWQHLDTVIASMIGPVTWLANADFMPKWKEGQKP